MKNYILSLFAIAVLSCLGSAPAAIVPQITFTQTTNAVLTWPSAPGDSFMVLHRAAFHPSRPWKLLATNLPAGLFTTTTFTHVGAYRILTGAVLTGGGGGGSPPGSPAAATLAAPSASSPTTTSDKDKPDKLKPKDSPAGPPALPDDKEMERLFREWLKESEKQQSPNSATTVQTLSATATYTLPDSAYTNFTGGFYVITRTTEDTDGDGLPDWWEATHGLNLLADDAQADPDGDGVPNLAEYAYGTNPRDLNSKPVVHASFTSPINTNTYLPVVQITGSINLNVRTLHFAVTNAAGVQQTSKASSPAAPLSQGPASRTRPPAIPIPSSAST